MLMRSAFTGETAREPPDPKDPRVTGLRRMRILATLLLVAMTVVFIAASFAQARWPWLAYVRAFAEAGMVGACADWFAVVALFRHPLGIPIPHTAIVPQNKARIAGAMGRFITNNFLTPRVLSERLAEVDAAHWVADWLASPDNARRVARNAALAIPELVRALPREQIADVLGKSVLRGLDTMPAAPVAANLLAIVWAQGQTQKLIERGLELVEAGLANNKDLIRRKVEEKSSRWIPRFVDGIVADKVVSALTTTLAEMRDPAHPWRVELKAAIETLIERLTTDPELRARVEAAKAELVANPLFRDQLHALWGEIENRLPADASVYSERIGVAVEAGLLGSGRWLRDDPALKLRINRWMRYLIKRAISPRRAEIGAFVTRVVEDWDATTLVNRMELTVGKDLQYIRINGTLVGGLVGVIIYTASKWFLPG
jgi:uncharacterized membrane-anchored protein YjiN (DUF445 family)